MYLLAKMGLPINTVVAMVVVVATNDNDFEIVEFNALLLVS